MMHKNKGKPILFAIGSGSFVGLLVTVIIAVIGAVLVAGEKIGEEMILYLAAVSLIVGSLIGAVTAVFVFGEKSVVVGLCSGGVNVAAWLCANVIFFGGRFQNVLATALLVIGVSFAVGLLGKGGRQRRFKRKKLRLRSM